MKPAFAKPQSVDGAETIKVLLVSNQLFFLEGLRCFFEGQPNIEIVGLEREIREAFTKAQIQHPSVILVHTTAPPVKPSEAVRQLRESARNGKVVLMGNESQQCASQAFAAGAHGYLMENTLPSEVLRAVEAVHCGELFFPRGAINTLLKGDGPLVQPRSPKN